MAATSVRRPIPAVVFILLLSLLSAIVWYRVLNRSSATGHKATAPTTTSRSCVPKPATRTTANARTTTPARTAAAVPVVWPRPSGVRVTVLNGTTRAGLAKSVAGQLRTRGFKITTISNDTVDTVTATQVRYGPALKTAARLVQLYLPGSRLVPNTGKATSVTVSLGSSYSRLSTDAAVAKAKQTAAPVTC
jgi:LytR cell envelope-related transcriptional attenuator